MYLFIGPLAEAATPMKETILDSPATLAKDVHSGFQTAVVRRNAPVMPKSKDRCRSNTRRLGSEIGIPYRRCSDFGPRTPLTGSKLMIPAVAKANDDNDNLGIDRDCKMY
jgi:hypothetical protein